MSRGAILRWIAFLFVMTVPALHADPLNFMVGDYTFVRPQKWTWVQPTTSSQVARLKIPGDPTSNGKSVYFYLFPTKPDYTPEKIIRRWQLEYFPGASKTNEPPFEIVHYGSTTVRFVMMTGDFSEHSNGQVRILKDYQMLIAIIEGKERHVVARLPALKNYMAKYQKDFKEMIASAFPAE